MKIQIKKRFSDEILLEGEAESFVNVNIGIVDNFLL